MRCCLASVQQKGEVAKELRSKNVLLRDLTQGRRHLGGRRRNSCSVVDVLVAVVAIRATYASRVARVAKRPDLAGNYENIFLKSCLEGLRK